MCYESREYRISLVLLITVLLGACAETLPGPSGDDTDPYAAGDELPLGEIEIEDGKADSWGYATQCKAIPDLEPLNDPYVTISLDGLSLHLVDRAGTYDRVFPIGAGQIEEGESLTPVSTDRSGALFFTRTDLPGVADGATPQTARWSWNYNCRFWWTDEDGRKVPVFAGLPFIRLTGASSNGYGIHGPVDYYTRSDGGRLRRGFVSHGCIRMEPADLVELYARIAGHRTPVRVQRAIERRSDDRAVDVDDPWIMSECRTDADCVFDGGTCRQNPYSGRGFCTQSCTRYCPDRFGYPTTFCVADTDNADRGMCVLQNSSLANGCRRFDHFETRTRVSRFGQSSVRRDVCLPGTDGWMGDRCLADDDCISEYCHEVEGESAGICSEACNRYCPDLDGGYAGTFCVDADPNAPGNGGMCVNRCSSNDDCALGSTCESSERHSQSWVVRDACIPY